MIEKEGPIHVSNVMLLDPKDGKPTRVGIEFAGRQALPRRDAAVGDETRLMAMAPRA